MYHNTIKTRFALLWQRIEQEAMCEMDLLGN